MKMLCQIEGALQQISEYDVDVDMHFEHRVQRYI